VKAVWAAVAPRLHRVPSASPTLRAAVGMAAVATAIALVARVSSLGVDRGRGLAFLGAIGVIGALLAVTVLPRAAGAAAAILLLVPLPVLGAARTRDVAVELAVLAVLAVELTAWAADLRSEVREDRASILHRAAGIACAIVGTAGVATVALAGADLDGPHGRAALVLGLAGVAGGVGLLAWRATAARGAERDSRSRG
jgi:hypothetical protein